MLAQPIAPLSPPPAAAQPAAAPAPQKPAAETTISDRREGSNDQKDWHFIGHVEMDRGGREVWEYHAETRVTRAWRY